MNTALAMLEAQAARRRITGHPGMRVGDSERDRTGTRLGQALSQGYLSMEDYETRLQRAFEADTAGALDQLLADLPISRISRQDPRRRARRMAVARRGVAIHAGAYLAMCVTVVGVWLAVALTVGAWYFWPLWPILGGGIGVISHALPVRNYTRRHRGATAVT